MNKAKRTLKIGKIKILLRAPGVKRQAIAQAIQDRLNIDAIVFNNFALLASYIEEVSGCDWTPPSELDCLDAKAVQKSFWDYCDYFAVSDDVIDRLIKAIQELQKPVDPDLSPIAPEDSEKKDGKED